MKGKTIIVFLVLTMLTAPFVGMIAMAAFNDLLNQFSSALFGATALWSASQMQDISMGMGIMVAFGWAIWPTLWEPRARKRGGEGY